MELKKHVAKSIAAAPRQLLVHIGFLVIDNTSFQSQENDTQDADNIKIGSIEYLCWEPSQRAEALIQANALIREFVCMYQKCSDCSVLTKVSERKT